MKNSFILELSHPKVEIHGGGKARGLRILAENGFRIPETYTCIWDAFERAASRPEAVLTQLRQEVERTLAVNRSYAIRSSANVEDSTTASFAGQFESVLEVEGTEAILQAIQQVWSSASASRAKSYLKSVSMDPADLKMAVLLQEMIRPEISGVAFSCNPLTGLDEVVIECVCGRGDVLVQGGVVPQRWVSKWGKWIAHPENAEHSDFALLERVAGEVKQIAERYESPADLEWVFDGEKIYWLQLRSIAALQSVNIYSNRIAREVLPGIIKPLVWSVNIPLVNSAWIKIFTELIGPNNLSAEELSKSFHYRAYFNMGVIGQVFQALGMPATSLELLMGLDGGEERPAFRPSGKVVRHLPRLVRFVWSKARYGRRLNKLIPLLREQLLTFAEKPLDGVDADQLLQRIDELFILTQKCAYANIVAPILMALYNKLLEQKLSRLGIDFVDVDVTAGFTEMGRFDPNPHLARLHEKFKKLPSNVQSRLSQDGWSGLETCREAEAFHRAIKKFINEFGHLSDSGNDFSRRPWRETPELVLKLVIGFVAASGEARKRSWSELPLHPLTRFRLNWIYRRARAFRYYREATGSLFTYGYGLFRNHFLALGSLFVQRDLLCQAEDIFYLRLEEIREIVYQNRVDSSVEERTKHRKEEIERSQHLELPEIIYGDEAPPLHTAGEENVHLWGIPTSRGYFRGSTIVIEEAASFDKMEADAVLVIPYSDVAWTPLFAQAGAVISESGGMLSHSSIVAREYGLPAVVSVTGACRRLPTGSQVTVDGFKGLITIHSEEQANS